VSPAPRPELMQAVPPKREGTGRTGTPGFLATSTPGARWAAIIGRRTATESLSKRSIPGNDQAPQPQRPTPTANRDLVRIEVQGSCQLLPRTPRSRSNDACYGISLTCRNEDVAGRYVYALSRIS
jgi:hypothetical protein